MSRVVHFEIAADDPIRAIRFYETVFEWRIEKWEGPMDYWLIYTGPSNEPGIDGAIMKREKPVEGEGMISYQCTIGVSDADFYAGRVTEAGGSLTMPRQEIPGVGVVYNCKDTEGNVFGIIQEIEIA